MSLKVGEDWTDSDENFKTTGTLESGDQTVNGDESVSGDLDVSGAITQGSEDILDDSDLLVNGGEVAQVYIQATAPAHVAGTIWLDTTNNILKIRNKDNSDWLSVWDLVNDRPIVTNLTSAQIIALLDADSITGTLLAAAIAGDALAQDGSGNLDVQVDDSTIEVSGDALQVKDAGITAAKLSSNAQVSVSSNDSTPGRLNGKLVAGDNITLTEGSDGGDETLTVDKRFRGALISLGPSDDSIADGSNDAVAFDQAEYDTDSFDDIGGSNPERLTITPADVSYVRLMAQLYLSPSVGGSINNYIQAVIRRNGDITTGDYAGRAFVQVIDHDFGDANDYLSILLITPPIPVSQNDYFDVHLTWTDSTGTEDLDIHGNLNGSLSWFSLEVIE